MITQTYDLNMIPGGVPVRVQCSQRDAGSRTVVFNLFNGSESFSPSNATARIDGTRSDGSTFTTAATLDGSTATWVITLNMTAASGEAQAELVVVDTSGNVLGSKNFIIDVEAYAKDPDTEVTEEETTIWEEMYAQTAAKVVEASDYADDASDYADAAAASATAAATSAASVVVVTYTLSRSSNTITLTGSDGSTSSITLPVYSGGTS